ARAARLPGRAERGQRVRWHAPYGFYAGPAPRALARAGAQHDARHGPERIAYLPARSDRGPPLSGYRRLKNQEGTDRLGLRECAHAGGGVLGLPARAELPAATRDVRRGAAR